MADRKLYHLINGEFVHDGMPSMRIPTYEEVSAHIAILNNVGFYDAPVAESVTFTGIGNGKRNTEVQASMFDAIHAEILGEHNAEKARVRNRRKADRKHKLTPKMRKEREYMRNWNVCMKMVNYGTWDDIPIVEGRVRSAENVAREDWDAELSALTEDIPCAEFMLESDKDDLEWLNNEIDNIGNPDGVIALYEERIKELRKESERKAKLEQYKVDTEKRIRNGEEYMRKYNYVKEMI